MIQQDRFGVYENLEVGSEKFTMRLVPGGTFMMGSPEDEPGRFVAGVPHNIKRCDEKQHMVLLTRDFWLAETACTQGLWHAVMGNNPSRFTGDSNLPVETVSWNDCNEFMSKLNKIFPIHNFYLPTEVQWEYACRAGTTTPFSFGNNITTDQVNYDGNYPYNGCKKGLYRATTVPVKTFAPNRWGFYEMHGNVWQWCHDWYEKYIDPDKEIENPKRVLRGGSWYSDAGFCRCATRYLSLYLLNGCDSHIGFRLSRDCAESDWSNIIF